MPLAKKIFKVLSKSSVFLKLTNFIALVSLTFDTRFSIDFYFYIIQFDYFLSTQHFVVKFFSFLNRQFIKVNHYNAFHGLRRKFIQLLGRVFQVLCFSNFFIRFFILSRGSKLREGFLRPLSNFSFICIFLVFSFYTPIARSTSFSCSSKKFNVVFSVGKIICQKIHNFFRCVFHFTLLVGRNGGNKSTEECN